MNTTAGDELSSQLLCCPTYCQAVRTPRSTGKINVIDSFRSIYSCRQQLSYYALNPSSGQER